MSDLLLEECGINLKQQTFGKVKAAVQIHVVPDKQNCVALSNNQEFRLGVLKC